MPVALFQASAALGREVAALLDTETPVPGVTTGKIRDDLKAVGVFTRVDGKQVNPDTGDLDLTAGWGHAGKEGVTMPGRGKTRVVEGGSSGGVGERTSNIEHRTPNIEGNKDSSLRCSVLDVGCSAFDVFLNDVACWRNIPEPVWEYTIGGYQVIKKWLSYRERPLLGRGLTADEVRYVTEMARRLAALVALRPALDANYKKALLPTSGTF